MQPFCCSFLPSDRNQPVFQPQGGDVSSLTTSSHCNVLSFPVVERELNVFITTNCVVSRYDDAGPPVDANGKVMTAGLSR